MTDETDVVIFDLDSYQWPQDATAPVLTRIADYQAKANSPAGSVARYIQDEASVLLHPAIKPEFLSVPGLSIARALQMVLLKCAYELSATTFLHAERVIRTGQATPQVEAARKVAVLLDVAVVFLGGAPPNVDNLDVQLLLEDAESMKKQIRYAEILRKSKSPIEFIDTVTGENIKGFTGEKFETLFRVSMEKGRQRFHVLYEAAQS